MILGWLFIGLVIYIKNILKFFNFYKVLKDVFKFGILFEGRRNFLFDVILFRENNIFVDGV